MGGLKAAVLAVVSKTDLVSKSHLAEQLLAVSRLGDFAEIVPVSALTGHGGVLFGGVDVANILPNRKFVRSE